MELNDQNIDEINTEKEIPQQGDFNVSNENQFVWSTKSTVKAIVVLFLTMVFYIYNSLHATKAIKRKEELKTTLKEFHSERISLESEITKSSKQTEIAERLKETGLKEITTPPIKLTRDAKK
jgi:hypothetical protein